MNIGDNMKFFRRAVLPSLWLVLGAVIAASLVKIAFVDGVRGAEQVSAPQVGFEAPVVPAGRATVTNVVEVKGSVQADPAIPVRSTESGTVVFLYISAGKPVAQGSPLFQVRRVREAPADAADAAGSSGAGESAQGKDPAAAPAKPAATQYDYLDVLAPSAGVLKDFTALLGQQVSVGENLGAVEPGTFSVSGSLDAQQQYRLLDRPAKAEVTVTGGPAPFICSDISLGQAAGGGTSKPADSNGTGAAAPAQQGAGPGTGSSDGGASATGTVSCPVPSAVKVFPGLGATLKLTAGVAENVLTVPLTAVKGTFQRGTVWVRSSSPAGAGEGQGADPAKAPDGKPAQGTAAQGGTAGGGAAGDGSVRGTTVTPAGFVERTVSLGLSDGVQVQITSGLKEGEQILEFLPGVPSPQGQGGPGGSGPAGFSPMGG
ncbi:biotin carboxyl carrier protein [Arthrobacter woluwensis]|uniref:hypothetical protein n=1 Tax=Arthrobacter woluwensis TaxID=156980 RepID=UPI00278B5871|nr:hypothetical protein [Arthrobacter woluwensis]MDQ0707753.1 biotin carboxyl carrier protein [Arthrobacter woluwensis]